MPNWCSFDACVYGNKREVEAFRNCCLQAIESSKQTKNWNTFELCIHHGLTPEEIRSSSFSYVGGEIDEVQEIGEDGDDSYVMINMTTRWSPMIDGFNSLLSRFYTSLKAVYFAEEPGMCIYINTDKEGRFFNVRYVIEDYDFGGEWFDSASELKDYVKSKYNYDLTDEEISKADKQLDVEVKYEKGKSFLIYAYRS